MKNYLNFILEENKPVMRYYAFDWDDNILIMDTVIHMEHLVDGEWILEDVSTEKFAKIRNNDKWRPLKDPSKLNNLKNPEKIDNDKLAFLEFRDCGPRDKEAFLKDVKNAIEKKSFGPSWDVFLECIVNGSIFAIITARGHNSKTIKKAVEYIIYNILTEEQKNEMAANLMAFKDLFIPEFDIMIDINFQKLVDNYLDKCEFIGVSSPRFIKKLGGTALNPEQSKKEALNNFIKKINKYGEKIDTEIKLGYSDDDVKTINNIEKHFGETSKVYTNIIFNVFNTSNPEKIVKKEI